MAPFAKSFGQAFSQSYDAESKRRRQKEDEIAQEERLEERMGRTRAYELGQELERESRSATRQLDLERRANELYDTRQSANDVRAIEQNARKQAEDANLRGDMQAEHEANLARAKQLKEDDDRFLAAAKMPSNVPIDFGAQDWRGEVKNVDDISALRKDQADLGLPMSPYAIDLPVRYEPDAAIDPIEEQAIYTLTEADRAAVGKAQRDRVEVEKDLASQRQIRESNQAFFREASSLVPLEYQSQITNDKGQITKTGEAFLFNNVKAKDFTYFDQIKGKDVTERRLTFIRPVQEPGGTGEPAVEQPAPLPTPTGNPIGGPKKDTAVNAVVMKRMGDEGMSPSQASVIKKILGSDLPDVSGRYSDAADIAIDKNIAASRMAIAEERKMQSMESAPLRDDTRGSLGLTRRVVSPFQAPDVNGMWQQLPLPQIIPRTARQQVEMENRIMESRQKEEALQKKMYELQIYKNTIRPPSIKPWSQPYYTE